MINFKQAGKLGAHRITALRETQERFSHFGSVNMDSLWTALEDSWGFQIGGAWFLLAIFNQSYRFSLSSANFKAMDEVPDGQQNGFLDESNCQYPKGIFSFTQEVGCPVNCKLEFGISTYPQQKPMTAELSPRSTVPAQRHIA